MVDWAKMHQLTIKKREKKRAYLAPHFLVFDRQVIVGAQFDPHSSGGTLKTNAFYNGQPYHALPIAVSFVLTGLAQYVYGTSYSISTSMEPLPKGADAEAEDSSTTNSTQGFLVGLCISFGMAFLTSSFVYFLVKEREVSRSCA